MDYSLIISAMTRLLSGEQYRKEAEYIKMRAAGIGLIKPTLPLNSRTGCNFEDVIFPKITRSLE